MQKISCYLECSVKHNQLGAGGDDVVALVGLHEAHVNITLWFSSYNNGIITPHGTENKHIDMRSGRNNYDITLMMRAGEEYTQLCSTRAPITSAALDHLEALTAASDRQFSSGNIHNAPEWRG